MKNDLSHKHILHLNRYTGYTLTQHATTSFSTEKHHSWRVMKFCVEKNYIADGCIGKAVFSGMICCVCRVVMILKHWYYAQG